MRRWQVNCALILFTLPIIVCPPPLAAQPEDRAGSFALDLPAGWTIAATSRKRVVLYAKKGRASLRVSLLSRLLSEKGLMRKIGRDYGRLEAKGAAFAGDEQTVDLGERQTLVYLSYELKGRNFKTGYFSWQGRSYALYTKRMTGGDFAAVIEALKDEGDDFPVEEEADVSSVEGGYPEALEDFIDRFDSPVFSGYNLSPENYPILTETAAFSSARIAQRRSWIMDGFKKWLESLRKFGLSEQSLKMELSSSTGGSLWGWENDRLRRLDRWKRERQAIAAVRRAVPRAATPSYAAALKHFNDKYFSPAFVGAELSAQNDLVLMGTNVFLEAKAVNQKLLVQEALAAWQKSLRSAALEPSPIWSELIFPSGGSLWRKNGDKVVRVENWSFTHPPVKIQVRSTVGRIFGYIGANTVVGGTLDSTALNFRLGTTLLNGSYDAALSFGYNSFDTNPKFTSKSYGIVARALLPLTRRIGWNIGGQITRSETSGNTTTDSFNAVGGFNFYILGGSVDLSGTYAKGGSYNIQLGYTVFLTKR